MLRLLIVTSGLFVSSFGVDVDFSFGKSCFSLGGDLELIAEYTGSGTVTAVQWYYSGQVGSNLIVLNSTCAIGGTPDLGYPDASRMVFTCPAINKFTLTLKGLLDDELKKSWGATFSLSSGSSPTVAQKLIEICPATTTTLSDTSTTTPPTTTTTPTTATTTPPTTTTTPPSTMTTPASTTTTMPITTTTMRTSITTSTKLATISTSSTKSSNGGLSDEMIIVIVIVPVGVIAIVGTVIFVCLFYRRQWGKRKPTSHKRHKHGKHYKDYMRPVQQHQQQPYILYGRGHTRESNHKETKRSRSLHNDDRYNWYDGYHWGSQVKQNPVYKGDRNLSRLYNNESLSGYDDYWSGYTKGHVYPSHSSGYHFRSDYHGDSRGHGNRQYSSYPVYSRQQEYIKPSYLYMGY